MIESRTDSSTQQLSLLNRGHQPAPSAMDLLKSDGFAKHVAELLRDWHVHGVSIAVNQNGVVASKGFGHASLSPPNQCTGDTLFDIASCLKSLTAASVALLCDDEEYPEVQWDATMSSLLPDEFVMSDESYTKAVTIEDVLCHGTGLAS